MANPAKKIYKSAFAWSAVDCLPEGWVKTAPYGAGFFHMPEQVKFACDREGVTIPFRRCHVHMIQEIKTA